MNCCYIVKPHFVFKGFPEKRHGWEIVGFFFLANNLPFIIQVKYYFYYYCCILKKVLADPSGILNSGITPSRTKVL